MNHKFTIAQPCSYKELKTTDDKGNREVIIKSNTHKPFILFDELFNTSNYQECSKFHSLSSPISYFTEVWKAIENTETWARYGYFLVARNIGVEQVKDLVNDGVVWDKFKDSRNQALYLPAFGDNQPLDHLRCITYDDTYKLIGRAWKCKLVRRSK